MIEEVNGALHLTTSDAVVIINKDGFLGVWDARRGIYVSLTPEQMYALKNFLTK